MAKKSFYLFFTALMGVLLFLILHRVAAFIFLYLIAGGFLTTQVDYSGFVLLEYFTLTIAIMLGGWYGIWLGLYWYNQVYEGKTHGGLAHHLVTRVFWDSHESLRPRLAAAQRRLEEDIEKDVDKIESLALQGVAQANWAAAVLKHHVSSVKRKVAHKRGSRKSK